MKKYSLKIKSRAVWLRELGKQPKEISEILNICIVTIRKWTKNYPLTKEERSRNEIERRNGISKKLKGKKKSAFTKEHIKNLSKSHEGLKIHSDDWKEKHRIRMRGEKNPFYKKKHTEETKAIIRAKRKSQKIKKGWKHTVETKKKIGDKKRGIHRSKKTKAKIRAKRLKQVFPLKDAKTTEVILQNVLTKEGIEFEKHIPILGQPDIKIKGTNILIFCDGDWWHRNPNFYSEDDIKYGVETKRIHEKDKSITERLIKRGYIVLRFWESDIQNSMNEVLKTIKQTARGD